MFYIERNGEELFTLIPTFLFQVNNKYFYEKLCRSVNENVVYRPPDDRGQNQKDCQITAGRPLPLPPLPLAAQKPTGVNKSTKVAAKGQEEKKTFDLFAKKLIQNGKSGTGMLSFVLNFFR